jgi:pimeloyl-ACP methyl ester carboxylesterase
MMKDRAGVVGGNGVAPLVQQLVNAGDARVHLIGHSYGAKVVLSAVASANGLTRPVDSVLLLQPAISAYSFADNVPGAGGPGKYRVAVDASRVRQPVFCTFSENDWPLTQIFHLFVNRRRDLGEAAPAAAAPAVAAAPAPPPNDFAALGGFGPQPLPPQPGTGGEVAWVFLRDEGERYSAKSGNRVIGLRNRGQQIACHGCVSNGHTWWALWNQVAGVPVGQ